MTNRTTAIVVAALSLTILSAKTNPLRPAEQLETGSAALHKASQQTTRRSWDELAREAQFYWTLRIALPDGTVIQGSSARLIAEGLTIRVEKTTNRERHPKGVIFIPREQVSELEIRTNQPIGRAVDRHFRRVLLLSE